MPERERFSGARQKPRSSETQAGETDPAIPTAAEENILAELHEHAKGNGVDEKFLDKLHSEVEHCECYPLFERYVTDKVPTLERMFGNLPPFLQNLSREIEAEKPRVAAGGSDEYLKELQSLHGLLSGRENQVRGALQRYVASVIRFRNLARLSAGGARDMSEQYVDADHARRRAHDNLIDSLRVYAEQLQRAKESGYDESFSNFSFAFWNLDTDARKIGEEKAVVMSPEALRHRDFIRDWAIVADFVEQLGALGDKEWIHTVGDRSN